MKKHRIARKVKEQSINCIKMKHIAMIKERGQKTTKLDDAMKKWIGSQEDYYFKNTGDNETTLEIVIQTDESFESMMSVWPQALQYFK